jgi:hypothetical protein
MVNVFLPDGSWAGQFTDEDAAKSWLKTQGIKPDSVEISRRRPEFKRRGEEQPA